MKKFQSILGITALSVLVLISCNKKEEVVETETISTEMIPNHQNMEMNSTVYNVGDKVPNNQVCMVNNAYMGKDQFEVPFDGKIYYGCCNMCVERIPNDESSRSAIDPFTNKSIDKSNAYIVLKDKMGNVDYFENEQNFIKYSQLKS